MMTLMAPLLKTMSPSSSLRTSSCQITIHSRLCWSMPPPAALLTLKTVLFYIFQCLCTVYPPSLHWLLMFRTHWRFNPANPQRPTVTKNNNNAPFRSLPLTLLSCIQDVPEWWWALYNIDQLHCPGSTPSGFIGNVFLQIGLVQRKASTPVLDNRLTFFLAFWQLFVARGLVADYPAKISWVGRSTGGLANSGQEPFPFLVFWCGIESSPLIDCRICFKLFPVADCPASNAATYHKDDAKSFRCDWCEKNKGWSIEDKMTTNDQWVVIDPPPPFIRMTIFPNHSEVFHIFIQDRSSSQTL